jgi:K+-sensing histidine kinase KdpD
MTTKKSKSKKSSKKPAVKRRIPRQDALPGMGDAKIAAIEKAALDYVEVRDQRQALTADEVSLKTELINLMHKAEKVEYKRNGISIKLIMEKENVKVRVKDEGDVSVDVEQEEDEGPEAA